MAAADAGWQRLDKWLWCARFMKTRADCARLAGEGLLRINRQPTGKAHARLRVGDVITLPLHGGVRVLQVLALAARRGPASEARLLYREIGRGARPRPPRTLAAAAKGRHIARLNQCRLNRSRPSRPRMGTSRPGVRDDLRGHRKLHPLQVHGLR